MAPKWSQQTFTALRVVTQRLASTSTQRLPHVVPSLAGTLSSCSECFLAAQSDAEAHNASEGPLLVHKLKTQISSLLQNRSAEARYAAIVLIKGIVEIGGWNVLQGANPWIKGLIAILGRSGSAISKRLSVVTIARMFVLNREYPSLVRELTTPSLPGFITSCLTLVKPAPQENDILCVVLQAFNELIPHHPASFRPHSAQMRALVLPLIAPIPSDTTQYAFLPSASVSEAARRLFVSLSMCTPKNASPEDWAKILR